MGASHFCSPDDFFLCRFWFPICDVFVNTAGKEIYILLNHSYITSQALECYLFNILSIQQDFSLRRIIKARDKIAQCCFPSSWRTNQGHFFSRFYRQVNVGKHRCVVVRILKRYMFKGDFSLYILKRHRPFFIKNINIGIHQLCKTFNAGHSSLELLCKFYNTADGCQQGCHI